MCYWDKQTPKALHADLEEADALIGFKMLRLIHNGDLQSPHMFIPWPSTGLMEVSPSIRNRVELRTARKEDRGIFAFKTRIAAKKYYSSAYMAICKVALFGNVIEYDKHTVALVTRYAGFRAEKCRILTISPLVPDYPDVLKQKYPSAKIVA